MNKMIEQFISKFRSEPTKQISNVEKAEGTITPEILGSAFAKGQTKEDLAQALDQLLKA